MTKTMIALEQEISRQENVLEASREELARLLNQIKRLREEFERGDVPEKSDVPEVKRLSGLVSACLDVEMRLGKCKELQLGIAQCGVAFDLDAARCSIGSKLDRLRDAGGTGGVSG